MAEFFEARVVSFQSSRVLIRDVRGIDYQCQMRQSARDLVTGDKVQAELLADGTAIVTSRHKRTSEFLRTDLSGRKKMIGANLDCLAIVVASQPEPHLAMIDRYLVGAELSSIPVELIINKSDFDQPPVCDEIRRIYPSLGYRVHEVSAKQGSHISDLAVWASGKHLAFLGQSGVGKSSLINALLGESKAEVGALSHKKIKGRHTTTASFIYDMPLGGWIMDSPGIRDFDNSSWQAEDVLRGFREINTHSSKCEFRNCSHKGDRGCAVIKAVEDGLIEPSRFENYLAALSDS